MTGDCKNDILGLGYTGTTSHTKSGLECQRWDSQSPHPHSYTVTDGENYCRNPDQGSEGPWCLTLDPGTEWEYCNIPICAGKDKVNLSCW